MPDTRIALRASVLWYKTMTMPSLPTSVMLTPPYTMPLAELLNHVQRATISYFWEGAHPVSGLAYDRRLSFGKPRNDLVSIGGSGFSFLAIIVAVSRGGIDRRQALERMLQMVAFLTKVPRFHGAFPHFINGATGDVVPFSRRDDGGDLVETALLLQGLICARQYFDGEAPGERRLRRSIQALIDEVEWCWYAPEPSKPLYWHWSPKHQWKMALPITGWNEGLLAYVLAAGARQHAVDESVFHHGWAGNGALRNGNSYYGHVLPVGRPFGGPLFLAHSAFCGLDPSRMLDRYCDYWEQNLAHASIHHAHAVANPNQHVGYGAACWGLTSSHGPRNYLASAPDHDLGIIAPTAALSSFPYLPAEAEAALRHYLAVADGRLWGRYGFVDAFAASGQWISKSYLAVNQGPIVAMIENHRSGLLWDLFMDAPEIKLGLERLGIGLKGDRALFDTR
ncbi:glucoamylase family protein [Rhizobium sp. TH2]|uniref:glucoamylase family protein n=1 Tax=Rhizobium sp. TH2 TaxID=2775403 RepID=UPI0021570D85|nr:glucoamylase family protein [Rhizobium sp. TH2]